MLEPEKTLTNKKHVLFKTCQFSENSFLSKSLKGVILDFSNFYQKSLSGLEFDDLTLFIRSEFLRTRLIIIKNRRAEAHSLSFLAF